jgi:hypothetical protein
VSNREVSARQVPRKGAMDGAVSERRRGGRNKQDVCDWNPSTPLGTVIKKASAKEDFFILKYHLFIKVGPRGEASSKEPFTFTS